jgi:hypothetical protein
MGLFLRHSAHRFLVARLSFLLVEVAWGRFRPSGLPEALRKVIRFPRRAAMAALRRSRSASSSAIMAAVSILPISLWIGIVQLGRIL